VSSDAVDPIESLVHIPTYAAGVVQSTAYRLLKKFTEDCIQPHGITMMQWFIIGTIYDADDEGIGVTQLSRAVDTNVPYITNTLNLLEQMGIVERETREGDNRSKVVHIIPAYLPTVQRIEQDLRRRMRETIYSNVTPHELRTYLTVLYKLTQSLEHYHYK